MASFWKKVGRIIAGKANDAVDELGDPATVGNQIIREMDDKIRKAEDALQDTVARQELVRADSESLQEEITKFTNAAREANAQGNKELAIKCADKVQALKAKKAGFDSELVTLEQAVENLNAQIETALDKRSQAATDVSVMSTQYEVAKAQRDVVNAVSELNTGDQLSDLGALKRKSEKMASEAKAATIVADKRSGDDLLGQVNKLTKKSGEDALAELLAEPT